ncbi:MAG: hypothetical protein KAH01_02510, partial [Caldisericia bacterium]|nr:hypothetical protein [Caldisericia bacterium]
MSVRSRIMENREKKDRENRRQSNGVFLPKHGEVIMVWNFGDEEENYCHREFICMDLGNYICRHPDPSMESSYISWPHGAPANKIIYVDVYRWAVMTDQEGVRVTDSHFTRAHMEEVFEDTLFESIKMTHEIREVKV